MYLSYYQLETKPFQINADPTFLWLGEKHKEALAVLRYGVMDNKGFLLLTGEVGTGKTTLINALVNTLGQEVVVATILDPGLDKKDFFNYIGAAFRLPEKFSTKGAFIEGFRTFLHDAHDQKKKVLLIIDESQRLNPIMLEEIRLLSNIEKQSTKLINIFFVGQKEFNTIILNHKNRALRQRITVNYDLQPLGQKEVNQYIRHRLKVAGAHKTIFKPASIREIYRFSKGYPRLINVICDRALLTGFTRDMDKITPKIIRECAQEVRLQEKKDKAAPSPAPEKLTAKPPSKPPRMTTKGRLVEKTLYVVLALMIVLWIAAAAYFYVPRETIEAYLGKADRKPSKTPAPIGEVQAPPAPKTPPATSVRPSTEPLSVAAKATDEVPIQSDMLPRPDTTIHIDLTEHNELTPEGIDTLNRLAALMEANQRIQILIRGYSGGNTGNQRYSQKMSEFTANIVKGFLVGKGVAPNNIETSGEWSGDPENEEPNRSIGPNTRWVDIQLKNG